MKKQSKINQEIADNCIYHSTECDTCIRPIDSYDCTTRDQFLELLSTKGWEIEGENINCPDCQTPPAPLGEETNG